MSELILGMQGILDRIKGFTCGSTSRNSNHMLIGYRGKRYIISIKEIENPEKDMFNDIDKYLN